MYDSLGLESAWRKYSTILVSDGGGAAQPEPEPKHDWAGHAYRVLNIVDNQVRSLRKRQLIGGFNVGLRKGTYWGVRSDIKNYSLSDALPCPFEKTFQLAEIPTRLKRLEPEQEKNTDQLGLRDLRCSDARSHESGRGPNNNAALIGRGRERPLPIR